MQDIERSLVQTCKQKDEKALFALYRHCFPMMKGIAMRYLFDKSRVGEVVNNGFLKIVNGLDKYDERQPFGPWATTIMVRTAIDHVRSTMRSQQSQTTYVEDDQVFVGTYTAINQADANFDAEELLLMMESLPDQTRVVFNLFAIEGYSHKEIAEMLQVATGTTKWHVAHARKELQKQLMAKLKTENIGL